MTLDSGLHLRGRAGSPLRASAVLAALLVACAGGDGDSGLGPGTTAATPELAIGARHACRADSIRTVCWGRGLEGQLGIGSSPVENSPAPLSGAPALTALTAGQFHTCGLDADGAAWCWGDDRDGQLGLGAAATESCGTVPCSTTPVRVSGDLRFTAIAAGARATCGLTREGGHGWCWGSNDLGQLGTSADTARCSTGRCTRSPMPVDGGRAYTMITAGTGHACALEASGAAWCWGYQPGSSDGVHTISFFDPDVEAVSGGLTFSRIEAGGFHTCALTIAGAAWCWGLDALGAGPSPLESAVPVAVAGGHIFREISSGGVTACAIDRDSAAWCWGPNTYGQVGVDPAGSTVRYDEPVALSGGFRFAALQGGAASACGITTAGGTLCWGRGGSGELGSGHDDRTLPSRVPGL